MSNLFPNYEIDLEKGTVKGKKRNMRLLQRRKNEKR